MRNLYLMSFSKAGEITASRIAETFSGDPDWTVCAERVASLDGRIAPVFKRENVLVFIGAAGIAVRAVAPFLRTKTTDPPVLVVDETGRFVIPILSGHLGGANGFAKRIAERIGAVPVITTATDLRGVFAVDSFAAENGYAILNPEMIKTISSRLLDGKPVGLETNLEIVGPPPENVLFRTDVEAGIYIGTEPNRNPFEKTLRLVPKWFHLGIGTRRGVSFDDLHDFVTEMLRSLTIPVEAVASVSSIELKKDEKAIVLLAERFGVPFRTYSKEELGDFEQNFDRSDFVRTKTGVGNICEISSWISSGKGELVLKKTCRSGMTLAVALENRKVVFEPTPSRKEETSE